MSNLENTSYGSILKSSSIIGGAQGISLLIGIVRTKFVAVLIGPLGIGLIGTYQAITGLIGTFSSLGIQSSAVRNVVAAAASGDEKAIGQTVLSLRRIALLTGLAGGILLALLAKPISQYTFGSHEYMLDIALLGITIFLGHVAGGQIALVQGMRRIGDLARLNVLGALTGTITALVFYSSMGLRGIVPALLSMAVMSLAWSWYFARRIEVRHVSMTWRQSILAVGGMVRLGLAFMWNGLLVGTVAYITRALITREISLEAVGIYTAAFALSGMFVNFVLQAMGADYYPRLTAVADDHGKLNQLVNEQMEIGLLLAIPGLLLTLSTAPWIISIFYTAEFMPAAELLQWFILGCLGRVISWPMGFVMLAKGRGGWFAATQTLFNLFHISMIWTGLLLVGVEGVAIAFFSLYIFSTGVVFAVAWHLTGFSWAGATSRLIWLLIPVVAVAFLVGRMFPIWPATIFGLVITSLASIFCLRGLVKRIGAEHRIVQMSFRVPGMRWVCGVR